MGSENPWQLFSTVLRAAIRGSPGSLELEALDLANNSGTAKLALSDVKMIDVELGFKARLDAIIAVEAQREELKDMGVREPFAHLVVANGVNGECVILLYVIITGYAITGTER